MMCSFEVSIICSRTSTGSAHADMRSADFQFYVRRSLCKTKPKHRTHHLLGQRHHSKDNQWNGMNQ